MRHKEPSVTNERSKRDVKARCQSEKAKRSKVNRRNIAISLIERVGRFSVSAIDACLQYLGTNKPRMSLDCRARQA